MIEKTRNANEFDECSLDFQNLPLKDLPLNFAYVPIQCYKDLCTPRDALECGTYFKNLSMPWVN